jgi:hypothetical protein
VDLRTGDGLNTLMPRFGDPLSVLNLAPIAAFFSRKILKQRNFAVPNHDRPDWDFVGRARFHCQPTFDFGTCDEHTPPVRIGESLR